jgi:O-ureido-D-serine cyclo-ligase
VHQDPRFSALSPLLYLRVDLLRLGDGRPCVLELESTEPSLFFDHAPGSAARFAEAIRKRL